MTQGVKMIQLQEKHISQKEILLINCNSSLDDSICCCYYFFQSSGHIFKLEYCNLLVLMFYGYQRRKRERPAVQNRKNEAIVEARAEKAAQGK